MRDVLELRTKEGDVTLIEQVVFYKMVDKLMKMLVTL
jgi:hypothetical protein